MIEIPKNSQQVLRLAITDFKGSTFVDLRLFYLDVNDEWQPSRRGLTISPGLWNEFVSGVEQLGQELLQRGLLEGVESE